MQEDESVAVFKSLDAHISFDAWLIFSLQSFSVENIINHQLKFIHLSNNFSRC